MAKFWERNVHSHDECGGVEISRIRWLENFQGKESFTFKKNVTTKGGLLTVIDTVAACVESATLTGSDEYAYYIINDSIFVSVTSNNRNNANYGYEAPASINDEVEAAENPFNPEKISSYDVAVTGSRAHIQAIFKELDDAFGGERRAQIKWWYKDDHGSTAHRNIYLPPSATKLLPEFYPDLGEDPSAYLRRYLESDAAVLLVAGDPGTGKTTLLRHLICDFNLAAHVVYDQVLMNTDQVFQNFLFEANSDLLIIEDADTILQGREDSGNKLMARFLNVSDGLIKLPNKKVVFTTNLSDFSKVDAALVRPGRCFDIMKVRPLNLTEAQAVAQVAGVAMPDIRHEYTLAELFNKQQTPTLRRPGF